MSPGQRSGCAARVRHEGRRVLEERNECLFPMIAAVVGGGQSCPLLPGERRNGGEQQAGEPYADTHAWRVPCPEEATPRGFEPLFPG